MKLLIWKNLDYFQLRLFINVCYLSNFIHNIPHSCLHLLSALFSLVLLDYWKIHQQLVHLVYWLNIIRCRLEFHFYHCWGHRLLGQCYHISFNLFAKMPILHWMLFWLMSLEKLDHFLLQIVLLLRLRPNDGYLDLLYCQLASP